MRAVDDFIDAVVSSLSDTPLPERYRKWAAVSCIAGALGRKCWFDRGAFIVRPNLFIMLVGKPGNGKTASMILPLVQIYKALAIAPGVKPESDDYNPNASHFDLEYYKLTLLKDRITPESMCVEMNKAEHVIMELNSKAQSGVFWDNSTTVLTNEFGTFMNRESHAAQSLLTELWDAPENYEYKTKTSGQFILKGPCLNWIAATTQPQLIENMPANARGQGLLSRIIVVYDPGGTIPKQLRYPAPDDNLIYKFKETLAEIARLRGEFKEHPSCKDLIRSDIESGLLPIPTDDNMTEYVERRDSHVIKVAMAISASRSNTMMITERDWNEAKELLFDAENLMPIALRGFGRGKAGQTADEVEGFIRGICKSNGKRGIHEKTLRREILRKAANAGEVDQLLNAMCQAGILSHNGSMYKLADGGKTKTDNH